MEKYTYIKWEALEDGIGLLTLNRPDAYNAINGEMMDELHNFWETRLYDLDTVVILMKGAGEKGFCAGLDVKWILEYQKELSSAGFYAFQAKLARINLAMRRAPQPIICMVHGSAVGLGFSIAMASDIRVISKDARFCAAFINIGLGGADMSCSYFLPRLIGAGRAYEFMYTGEMMSSEEAVNLGFVSKMVEREELFDVGLKYAKTLCSKNHFGLRLTKEAINMNLDAGGLEQALNMEDRNQTLLAAISGIKSSLKPK